MKVLITGSSGQIGTNLGLSLLAGGHEVLGIDNRPNSWTDEIDNPRRTFGPAHRADRRGDAAVAAGLHRPPGGVGEGAPARPRSRRRRSRTSR